VIMQRLHEDDLAGVIIKLKMGFVHLMVPQEFEPERRCETIIGTHKSERQDPWG